MCARVGDKGRDVRKPNLHPLDLVLHLDAALEAGDLERARRASRFVQRVLAGLDKLALKIAGNASELEPPGPPTRTGLWLVDGRYVAVLNSADVWPHGLPADSAERLRHRAGDRVRWSRVLDTTPQTAQLDYVRWLAGIIGSEHLDPGPVELE